VTSGAAATSAAAAAAAAAATVAAAAEITAVAAVEAAAAADWAVEAAGAVPAMALTAAAAAAPAPAGGGYCSPLPPSCRGGGARSRRLPGVPAYGRARGVVALGNSRPPASVDGFTTLEAVAETAPDVVVSLVDANAAEAACVQ